MGVGVGHNQHPVNRAVGQQVVIISVDLYAVGLSKKLGRGFGAAGRNCRQSSATRVSKQVAAVDASNSAQTNYTKINGCHADPE
jgi:hypothetical protein